MKQKLSVGDRVRHRSAFLRSTGWYTNVPRYGIVTDLAPFGGPGRSLATVEWSEFPETPGRILDANIERVRT